MSIKTLENLLDPCLPQIKKRQVAHCSSRDRKNKAYGINTPCKNKYIKGSVKPFLCNIFMGLVKTY